MEVPGIEPATLWSVVRHADPQTNEAVGLYKFVTYVNVNLWQYHGVAFFDKVLESFNNSHVPVDLFQRFATEIGLAGK